MIGLAWANLDPSAACAGGYLGVDVEEANGSVRIVAVKDGSPAEQLHLTQGMYIVGVNGRPIRSTGDIKAALAAIAPHRWFLVDLVNEGRNYAGYAKMASDESEVVDGRFSLGMMGKSGLDATTDSEVAGAVISKVLPSSPAAAAGLRTWDLIMTANGNKLLSHAQLAEMVLNGPGEVLELEVNRHGRTYSTTLAVSAVDPHGPAGRPVEKPIETSGAEFAWCKEDASCRAIRAMLGLLGEAAMAEREERESGVHREAPPPSDMCSTPGVYCPPGL